MLTRSSAIRTVRPFLDSHPRLAEVLRGADQAASRLHHGLARAVPALIRPQPRQLTVAVTAACNLKCIGCRYGRDFMLGARLELPMVRELLDDAAAGGVNRVRFYGGEPLLHPDLPAMIAHARALAIEPYVTTNGVLLEKRVDELMDAGLAWMSIGFYGVDAKYDEYTQKEAHFQRLERSLELVRARYPHFPIQLNWTVLRPTCNLEALREAWNFARRFDLLFHLDLYMHYNPFFSDGPERKLAFRSEDRPRVQEVVDELVRLRRADPARFPHSEPFLRSVPDWLILGADMRVPCDAYQLLWVGANGSVQLCDVAFPLGNLHERPLRDILFGDEHRRDARDGFALKCPNCTCKCESRIAKHAPSYRRYGSRASE
jgi:cyclic pyranopterin phosphate synthase